MREKLTLRESRLPVTSDEEEDGSLTYPGQAHFIKTRTAQRCIDCKFWGMNQKQRQTRRQRKSKFGDVGTIPETAFARCGRFGELVKNRDGSPAVAEAIPGWAYVCRDFDPYGT